MREGLRCRLGVETQKTPPKRGFFYDLEAAPRFELGIKVLQTSALPLGYAAGISSETDIVLKNERHVQRKGVQEREIEIG